MKRFHVHPWEFFHTLDNIPVFNETAPAGETQPAACCVPAPAASAVKAGGCC